MVEFMKSKEVTMAMWSALLVAVLFVHDLCPQDSPDTMTTHYLLSNGVYATAEIPPTDKVLLWLGVSAIPPKSEH